MSEDKGVNGAAKSTAKATPHSPVASKGPSTADKGSATSSSAPRAVKGFVAFFDILGYQKIIDNNEVGVVARLITDVIERIPANVSREIATLNLGQNAVVRVDRIQCRIISDSILLSCEWADGLAGIGLFLIFKLYCATLMKLTFDAGLPLRGALSYGDYFVSNNSFAGKPIIDCYILGNALALSGCVMTSSAATALQKIFDGDNSDIDPMPDLMAAYSVPFKDGPPQRLLVLKWALARIGRNLTGLDVRSYVIEAFQQHNKDIEPQVLSKVENTEMLLRRIWPGATAG